MRGMHTFRIALILALAAAPLAADWEAGLAAFRSADYATAEAEFRAVVERQPEWPGGHRMLGQTLVLSGRSGEAVVHLERAWQLSGDLETALELSQTYLQLKRFDDAVRTLAGKDPAGLAPALRLAFYRTRGVAALKLGQYKTAFSDLTRVCEAAPRDAGILFLLATAADGAGHGKVAMARLEQAAELAPRDAKVIHALAEARHGQALSQDSEARIASCAKAAETARIAVELDPTYDNLLLFGESASCAGDHQAAVEPLRQAAAERPGEWRPEYYLARAYTELENWAAAAPALQRTLATNLPEERRSVVWGLLGYVHEKQDEFELAADWYRRAGDAEAMARALQSKELRDREAQRQALANEARRIDEAIEKLNRTGELQDPDGIDPY